MKTIDARSYGSYQKETKPLKTYKYTSDSDIESVSRVFKLLAFVMVLATMMAMAGFIR